MHKTAGKVIVMTNFRKISRAYRLVLIQSCSILALILCCNIVYKYFQNKYVSGLWKICNKLGVGPYEICAE